MKKIEQLETEREGETDKERACGVGDFMKTFNELDKEVDEEEKRLNLTKEV